LFADEPITAKQLADVLDPGTTECPGRHRRGAGREYESRATCKYAKDRRRLANQREPVSRGSSGDSLKTRHQPAISPLAREHLCDQHKQPVTVPRYLRSRSVQSPRSIKTHTRQTAHVTSLKGPEGLSGRPVRAQRRMILIQFGFERPLQTSIDRTSNLVQ